MGSAVIGALRVMLAMNTAEYGKNATEAADINKRLEATFASLGSNVSGSMQAIAASVLAAFGPAALAYAVKSAINLADETGKMAQSVGISTTALTRLEGAAGLAGLTADDLKTAIVKLTNAMESSAVRGDATWRAFDAIGVKARDATGNLRGADVVMAEIADRFSKMADGANKTKIAVELFGRAGANMIPLLNGGADGLKAVGDRAEAAGLVISTKLAKESEEFNDTLKRLAANATAFGLGVAEKLLPQLQLLASAFEENGKGAHKWGETTGAALSSVINGFGLLAATAKFVWDLPTTGPQAILKGLGLIADNATGSKKALESVGFAASDAAKQLDKALGGARMQTAEEYRRTQENVGKTLLETATMSTPLIRSMEDLRNIQDLLMKDQLRYADQASPVMQAVKKALDSGKITWEEYKQIAGEALNIQKQFNLDELNAVLEKQATSISSYRDAIQKAEQNGAITHRQATKFYLDDEKNKRDAILSTASLAASTLTAVFAKSKAAAIAAAVINTAVGVTKALSDPSLFFPMNWAQAALITATGAAQIASINSASASGGGSAAAAPSGGASAAAPQAQAAPPQRSVLEVRGLAPGQMISSEVTRAIVQGLIDWQKDGGEVILA